MYSMYTYILAYVFVCRPQSEGQNPSISEFVYFFQCESTYNPYDLRVYM